LDSFISTLGYQYPEPFAETPTVADEFDEIDGDIVKTATHDRRVFQAKSRARGEAGVSGDNRLPNCSRLGATTAV
jgi:hypothetical protein